MASIAKLVIAESRAFPEIGRFYLKEVIGRGVPLFEGLIARGIASGEFRRVDPGFTVRSLVAPMLLGMVWKTVFEPIGGEKLDLCRSCLNRAVRQAKALGRVARERRAPASDGA